MQDTIGLDFQSPLLLIGQGFNTITGAQGGNSVIFRDEQDLVTTGAVQGQTTIFQFKQLTNLTSLREGMNATASA
jgi:hypothetical protein